MKFDKLDSDQQKPNLADLQNVAFTAGVVTEEVISLLEERLMVDFTRRKVGEIVVRKEIKTHILQVQVPVRREKLIIEQISPDYKRLAEVDLGQGNLIEGEAFLQNDVAGMVVVNEQLSSMSGEKKHSFKFNQSVSPTITGEVKSLKAASSLLDEITNVLSDDCETIRIEIVLKDSRHQATCQALFEHYSQA